jgi:hypothetical protein
MEDPNPRFGEGDPNHKVKDRIHLVYEHAQHSVVDLAADPVAARRLAFILHIVYTAYIPVTPIQGRTGNNGGSEDLRRRTEIIPVKDSHTRTKLLLLASGHGRYIAVTPERALVSVGEWPLNIAAINL